MNYKLYTHEVEVIKSALNAHINQCERALSDGFSTEEEAERVIAKVERMKDVKRIFEKN